MGGIEILRLVSAENVELHRRIYEAFNARDIEAMIALCDPDIEFHSRFVTVGGVTIYRGHAGMREWHQGFEEVWRDDVRVEPDVFFDLGEQTLALATAHARGRRSGTMATMELFQALTWQDGLCTVLASYGDRDEALSALDVSEDALEEIAP